VLLWDWNSTMWQRTMCVLDNIHHITLLRYTWWTTSQTIVYDMYMPNCDWTAIIFNYINGSVCVFIHLVSSVSNKHTVIHFCGRARSKVGFPVVRTWSTASYRPIRALIVWFLQGSTSRGLGVWKYVGGGQSKMPHSFSQSCCWLPLQVLHHRGWKTCVKMEGKTNFSRRLKQFDGLTW